MSARHCGDIIDPVTPFSESGSQSSSGSSSVTSFASAQWSLKRRELYNAMTGEECGLFDELQAEITELKQLLTASDGLAKSKVHTCFFMLN